MISQEDIARQLYYLDGKLFWKEQTRTHKANIHAGYTSKEGYRVVWINGKARLEHRLIWCLFHGTWPKLLDHKDRDRSNNRVENLRPATHSENGKNSELRPNASGYRGVTHRPEKWIAQTKYDDENFYIGAFDSALEAALAYDAFVLRRNCEFSILNFPEEIKNASSPDSSVPSSDSK